MKDCRRSKVGLGNRGKAVKLKKKEILDWLKNGGTLTSLARKLGITVAPVAKRAKELGIKSKIGRPKGIPMSDKQKSEMTKRNKGSRNPFYGKTHTDETKLKMSKNHADFSGDKNPFKKALERNPEKRIQASNRVIERWKNYSEEKKMEISKNLSLAQSKIEKTNPMSNSKSGFFVGEKCGKIFYRSSWEYEFSLFLENNNLVESFSLEKLRIKYIDKNGIEKINKIDFLIILKNKKVIMVEVKPIGLLNFENNPYKIKAQVEHCLAMGWKHYVLSSTSKEEMEIAIS